MPQSCAGWTDRRPPEGVVTTAPVEVLTLDMRGDNEQAGTLYESLGFVEYGRPHRFVALGAARYDKVCCALDLR